MTVTERFRITVYDGDFHRKGPLGAFTTLTGEVAFNAPGSATIVIPASHPRAAQLAADGARVRIEYRPGTDRAWGFLLSGYVTETEGTGSRWQPTRSFAVVDDYAALTSEILCWPNPTGALTAQGADGAYFTKTGPAETVLKQILAPNVTRDGIPLTIPTTTGLGSTITCSVRMHYITERIMPMFEDAGLGVRVTQTGDKTAHRTLEVWAPTVHTRVLTQESGIVVDGSWSKTPPTVTRVVAGTSGEGTARTFERQIDTALEAQYKVKLCQFVDARDLDTAATDYSTQLAQRLADALSEGAPKASLSATLAETGQFRFKVDYDVGDTYPLQFAGGPVIADKVRSVQFSADKDSGVKITPVVGDWQDSTDATVMKRVAALQRAVSDLQKR